MSYMPPSMYGMPYGMPQFQPQQAPAPGPMPGTWQQPRTAPSSTQQMPQDYAAYGVRFTNGIEEVRSCITPFGERFLFMDRNEPVFYVRDVSSTGVAEVKAYRFDEFDDSDGEPAEYVTVQQMQEAIKDLEARYESLVQPNAAADAVPDAAIPVVAEPIDQPYVAAAPAAVANAAAGSRFATGRIDAVRKAEQPATSAVYHSQHAQ